MADIRSLLRVAAACSVVGAVTTAVLTFGPSAAAVDGFDAQQALHADPMHTYKRWILFFHPQLNFIAALGLAVALVREAPARAGIGLFYFLVWALCEMTQQAFLIDALNQIWRPAYLAAEGADREALRVLIVATPTITDVYYFVLLFAFGMGSLLLGWAVWGAHVLRKAVSVSMLFFGMLSLVSFVRWYGGAAGLEGVVDAAYGWVYSWMQPVGRLLQGALLWMMADGALKDQSQRR